MVQESNVASIYAEVYDCLNILGESYISKLPEKLYEVIKSDRDMDYVSKYNSDIGITEDTFSRETFNIIAGLDLKYWCNEQEKQEKLEIYNKNEENYQQMIKEKYNPDNIFKKNNNSSSSSVNEVESSVSNSDTTSLVEVKPSLFTRIKNFFKSIFPFE